MLNQLKGFFGHVLQRNFLKYIIPFGLFGIVLGLVFIVFIFTKEHYQINIDMISDHDGMAQLFWAKKNKKFRERFSIRLNLNKGNNHLKFSLPLASTVKLEQLRFDPTEKVNGNFEITKVEYIHNGEKYINTRLEN